MCDYRPIGLYEITLCIHTQVVSAFTWVYKQQKKMRIRELHSHVWQTDRVSNKIMRAAWTKLKCKSIKQINWVNVLRHTNTDNRPNNKKSTNVIVIKSATREKAYFPVNDCQSIASPARGRGWSADEFTYSDILSATVTLDIGNWDKNNHPYLKCIYEEHAATSREMENIMSAIANATPSHHLCWSPTRGFLPPDELYWALTHMFTPTSLCGLCPAIVPPASRPMSPRSIVITLTCINLWQRVVRISTTVSTSPEKQAGATLKHH